MSQSPRPRSLNVIREIRIKTSCRQCASKCCTQPFDWVYLTSDEIARLHVATGVEPSEFVVRRDNANTGSTFRSLDLPCRFYDHTTGECTVYDHRPLVCKVFPFYPEPLTGHACLLPAQCGDNLDIFSLKDSEGWALAAFEEEMIDWLRTLWAEANGRG